MSQLTSRARTAWADCRKQLIHSSPTNAAVLQDVENALFGVTLLDRPVPSAVGRTDKGYIFTNQSIQAALARQRAAGGGEVWEWLGGGELAETGIDMEGYVREVLHGDGKGLWFDKCFTIVVCAYNRYKKIERPMSTHTHTHTHTLRCTCRCMCMHRC